MAIEESDHSPVFPAYYGIPTFMRQPYFRSSADADIVVVGIPYDGGSTSYRTGSRFAPRSVREASLLLWGYNRYFGIEPAKTRSIIDYGDINIDPVSIDASMVLIEEEISGILAAKPLLIGIGGDHSITLALLRSFAKQYGTLGVVQFDAHVDTERGRMDHGTPFYYAVEEGLIERDKWVQIGVRGPLASPYELEEAKQLGASIFDIEYCFEHSIAHICAEINERMGPFPVYISFDMDVADPAYAPGVGTPEIGGLTSIQIIDFIRHLSDLHIVGLDVVEIIPTYDPSGITSLLGAAVIFECISGTTALSHSHNNIF